MATTANPVTLVIEKAGGAQALADLWDVTWQAINGFERKGWLPLPRARDAATRFDMPLRDLVRPDIREAIIAGVQEHLLSD